MKKIITIDGPSGVGKTTIGKDIALNLNYSFFSSGKLYRYVSKYSYDENNYKYDKFKLTIDISGNCIINNRKYELEKKDIFFTNFSNFCPLRILFSNQSLIQ